MKHNVSFNKLIRMIRNGKIENNTIIYTRSYNDTLVYDNNSLYFLNCYGEREPINTRHIIFYLSREKYSFKRRKIWLKKKKTL